MELTVHTAHHGSAITAIDGTITYINDYFAGCHGYEPSELVGESIKQLHNEAQHPLVDSLLAQVRTKGRFGLQVVPHCHRDGTVFRMLMTSHLLKDDNGAPQALAVAAIDITEMKAFDAQSHNPPHLESIGQLAGGIAHHYNNMLGGIIGQAQTALKQMGPTRPISDKLNTIHEAAQRSANLTRQLLAFARKQTIIPRTLDLNETIGNTIDTLRGLAGEEIQLTWIPGTDLWPVKMDPSQIDQLLTNLCANARDAISDKGEIVIETANATIGERHCRGGPKGVHGPNEIVSGDFVLLSVTDNGCGMDTQTRDEIFEPFFTTKDLNKNPGLGLSAVYGIVKQNEGMVNVSSKPGQGATFSIYLPACTEAIPDQPAEQHAETAKPARAGGNETILVVDDEPAILQVAHIALERQGYIVLTAGTPSQAIKQMQEHEDVLDLLITDVVMPEMDGFKLADHLLALQPNLSLLFMSGHFDTHGGDNPVVEGKGRFIPKPFTIEELTGTVRTVLDARRNH